MVEPFKVSKNIFSKQECVFLLLFLFITAGTVFANFNGFIGSELKSKWYWLYITTSVYGLLSLFIKNVQYIKVNTAIKILILLWLYCFAKVVSGPYIYSFLTLSLLCFIIYYLLGQVRGQMFQCISIIIAIVAFCLALYGGTQYIGLISPGRIFKVVGNFDNPAGYASILTFSIPFVLYISISEKRWVKYFAWSICGLLFLSIIISGSRAGIIASGLVGLIYLFKQKKAFFTNLTYWKKVTLISLLIAILFGLYYHKKDSADGRILIWKCSLEMIKDKPISGHGYKSFQAKYMLYQAKYFEQNPDSRFILLADNVKHPFNEYLLFIIEFGLIGFALLVAYLISIVKIHFKNPSRKSFILVLSLTSILIYSCFSYPFAYPFTWLILIISIGSLSSILPSNQLQLNSNLILKVLITTTSIILLFITIKDMIHENKWYDTTCHNQFNKRNIILAEYAGLNKYFNKNPYFIYSYAAQLNLIGELKKSTELVNECEKLLNDYDVQMLKGDDYMKQQNFNAATDCFLLASQMCPSKFMPLYELVNLYDKLNQSEMALKIANEIIDKSEKIPSAAITAIKAKMQERVSSE